MRKAAIAAVLSAAIGGCASMVHGPMQHVRVESDPPGAKATISPMQNQRGPLFLPEDPVEITTPATVRLRRDTTYRVEFQKTGYVIDQKKIESQYDWVFAPVTCGPCEAIGALPTFDMKEHALPVRFAEAAFYEYPTRAIGAFGKAMRITSPEAILGDAFKLKSEDDGYFENWTGLGTPVLHIDLKPIE